MGNIFHEKTYKKWVGETIPRPFSEKIKTEHISGWRVWNFVGFVLLHVQVEDYQNVLKLTCWTLTFTLPHIKLLKNKKRSEASLPASFSAWVLKKIIWFHCVIAFVYEIFGNMCNEECPLGQYSMYNISRDVGKHYIQYIMNNCSLMITNICIFVSTLKSLISKTNKKIFDDFLNYGEAAAIRLYS